MPAIAGMYVTCPRSLAFTLAATALLTVVLAASPALAQPSPEQSETREGVLEDARNTLAVQVTPPTRSTLERGLSWYDNQYLLPKLFGGWKGFHLASGDFPAGAGMRIGVAFDKGLTSPDSDPTLPNRLDLTASAAYGMRGYVRTGAGLNARNLGGAPIDLGVFGEYYEFPQEDFFGLGQDSSEEARTNYLLDAIEAGVAAHWRPSKLDFGAKASYFAPRIGRGTDSRYPSVEDVFAPGAVPGLGMETDYLKAEVSAAFEWRDTPSHARSGGYYAVSAAKYDDRDAGQFDFYRYGASVVQYVPLPNRYRRIALRGDAVFTDADSDQVVPFYLQPTLGGASRLRGFREFRFRDENAVFVGAEYQWEAWWALDAAVFADAGTVARTRSALSIGDMEASYGFGLRFHSNSSRAARLDLAFSREGFIPFLRFDYAF